ncbi:MAG: response regulator [Nannocystaceae bacterium]
MANILLVEDNHHNQTVFTATLTHHQHRVTLAQDGEEALEVLESMVPELIILDLSLPRVDGWTVAKTIRASSSEGLQKVPIIAVTAHAMKGDRQRALEAGCNAYLSKPVSPRELARKVSSILAAS